MARSAKCDQIP
jgi:hypothetical protein